MVLRGMGEFLTAVKDLELVYEESSETVVLP